MDATPFFTVVVPTYDRRQSLGRCLERLRDQTLPSDAFEVVVVDDGSASLKTTAVLERFADELPVAWVRIDHAGRAAAKNLAVMLARADVVLFFDDDDRADAALLREHLAGHEQHPREAAAVLGFTAWAPELAITPLMHYLTDVDQMLFSYGNLHDGQRLDWRGFWEGRVSSKRSLHVRHGLHDQRLEYSIDVEMAWRLARHGLEVHYRGGARSVMARTLDFDGFCRRFEAKGRAQAAIAALHPEPEVLSYTNAERAAAEWDEARGTLTADIERARQLEAAAAGSSAPADERQRHDLHRAYRRVFQAMNAKGFVEASARRAPAAPQRTPVVPPAPVILPSPSPQLTITIPVWSRTEELADMAVRTIDRVWEVARLRTEVVVVDNGSTHQRGFNARVHRFEENRGVSVGWNTGIALATAPVVCVLNSDCLVEPGWDEALYEAATTGRRIAFPYTDHGDGNGFRQPDQAGTAGWCFMLTAEVLAEIGPFDERFSPAYGEDTDYWHRAWEAGVELSPVPAARVRHERRTTAGNTERTEWLLLSHRYLYGWKHGVEPLRAPPYYNREIVEFHGRGVPVS